MPDIVRTFIAMEFPEAMIHFASGVQEKLKPYGFKIRWVRPENMHLTLKFLGDTPCTDTEKIKRAISDAAAAYPSLKLSLKGIGVFPGVKKPRVIWCGLKGDTASVIQIQSSLDLALADIGFPREKRPFKTHLTLGRVKGPVLPEKLLTAIKEISCFASASFAVNRVTLFRSDLKPTGAVYTRLKTISL